MDGTTGKAKMELRSALSDTLDSRYLDSDISSLIETLPTSSFAMANLILYDKQLTLNPVFNARAQNIFHASTLAFNASLPHEIIAQIDNRVLNVTQGHLSSPISSDFFTPFTRLVLLNVAHLSANWRHPFDRRLTRLRCFYTQNHDPQVVNYQPNVPTMQIKDYFRYTEKAQFSLIDLPLKGTNTSQETPDDYMMTILLPHNNVSLSSVVDNLDWWSAVSRRIDQLPETFLDLRMPRFRIRNKVRINQVLQSMGVQEIFSRIASNSSFFQQSNVSDLYVSEMFQEASIDVNEEGVTASAVTVVRIDYRMNMNKRPIIVKVNRPFMYFIWHPGTQLVLFAGAVHDMR